MKNIFLLASIVLLCVCCKGNQQQKTETSENTVDESYSITEEDNFDEDLEEEILTDMPIEYVYALKGVIDNKYAFTMTLHVDSTAVTGEYRYQNKEDALGISGTLDNNVLLLQEFCIVENGECIDTGTFDGHFYPEQGKFTGKWYSADRSKSYPFEMKNYCGVHYPQFSFKSNIHKEEERFSYYLNHLDIYEGDKQIQSLYDFEATPIYHGITMVDVDFDGYLDIALMESLGARTATYLYWRYDPELKCFVQTNVLNGVSVLSESRLDYENKTLHYGYTFGSDRYGYTTYQFVNGEYLKIESYYYEETGGNEYESIATTTTYKIVDGQSVEDRKMIEEIKAQKGNSTKYEKKVTRYRMEDGEWVEMDEEF